jgi:AcrR family transcriptional regulator
MARPVSITDDSMLRAAREEFLAHGIRATSAAIARRAGVSHGILFHRFGSKEALFAAAMQSAEQAAGPLVDLRSRGGKGDVRETLVELGELLLDRFFVVIPAQVITWANPNSGKTAKPGKTVNPVKDFKEKGVRGQRQFAQYLRAEARLKRIRDVDPYVVAQTFSGALWFYAFEQVTGARLRGANAAPERGAFVRQLVDFIWGGLQA